MPLRIKSKEEYDAGSGDFPTLEEDAYIFEIDRWEVRENQPSKYNPEGKGETVWFFNKPVAFADDPEADLLNSDGSPVHPDRTLVFFFDPTKMGTKPVVSKNRRWLYAVLDKPINEPLDLDFDDWGELYESLVGKRFVAGVLVDNGNNKIDNALIKPARQPKRRTRSSGQDLKAKAEEIFEGTPVDGDDDY